MIVVTDSVFCKLGVQDSAWLQYMLLQMHKEVPPPAPWRSVILRHQSFKQRLYYLPRRCAVGQLGALPWLTGAEPGRAGCRLSAGSMGWLVPWSRGSSECMCGVGGLWHRGGVACSLAPWPGCLLGRLLAYQGNSKPQQYRAAWSLTI